MPKIRLKLARNSPKLAKNPQKTRQAFTAMCQNTQVKGYAGERVIGDPRSRIIDVLAKVPTKRGKDYSTLGSFVFGSETKLGRRANGMHYTGYGAVVKA